MVVLYEQRVKPLDHDVILQETDIVTGLESTVIKPSPMGMTEPHVYDRAYHISEPIIHDI